MQHLQGSKPLTSEDWVTSVAICWSNYSYKPISIDMYL